MISMSMIRLILLLAIALQPAAVLWAGASPANLSEEHPSCCAEACPCSLVLDCPCVETTNDQAPGWPATPAKERVTVENLFDRHPQPVYELSPWEQQPGYALFESRPGPPTRLNQRLSFLCLWLT